MGWQLVIDGTSWEVTPLIRYKKKADQLILEQMVVTESKLQKGKMKTMWVDVHTHIEEMESETITPIERRVKDAPGKKD